ncbi:MAG TPA: T9SS type A sorting domain-containing protein [Saprospiraceae bacterium]|nr:T9SS type A sorting domain-containing protein [Saprospiraceae bacterium]HND87507.1 T9SS type A sorting domain-containing protein [Saprospiraceae bacterium]
MLRSKLSFAFGAMLLLLLASCGSADQNQAPNPENLPADYSARLAAAENRPDKLSVRPPFEGAQVNVAPSTHTVQPGQTTTLTMPSGSTVEIPAAVFVTLDGQPVTKPVDIQFREFHNAAHIIASGIPMKVRGANGHEEWMQTAGMFEIKGSSEGREVKIAPGKSITVNLVSEVSGEYPAWYFDPAQGNWVQQGTNTPTASPAAQSLVREVASLRAATAQPPVAPLAVDKSKPSLDFKLDLSEFPELRSLRNIVWQYAGDDPKLDPANNRWIKKTNWSEAKLEEGKKAGQYILTLVGDEQDYIIPVQASLSGSDLSAAQASYEKAMVKYRELQAQLEDKAALMEQQASFRRSMRVQGFGIYNYDRLLHRSDALATAADFDFGPEIPPALKKLAVVYLITADQRGVIELPFYDWSSFSYLPAQDNRMVAVLPGNRIATFSQDDFEDQRQLIAEAKGGRYVFKMKVDAKPVGSQDELQQRLLNPGEQSSPANGNTAALMLDKVFPNPLEDVLNVVVSSRTAQQGRIRVLSMSGATVLDEAVQLAEGENQLSYPLPGGMVAGAYSVAAVGADGRMVSRQVVKQ